MRRLFEGLKESTKPTAACIFCKVKRLRHILEGMQAKTTNLSMITIGKY